MGLRSEKGEGGGRVERREGIACGEQVSMMSSVYGMFGAVLCDVDYVFFVAVFSLLVSACKAMDGVHEIGVWWLCDCG